MWQGLVELDAGHDNIFIPHDPLRTMMAERILKCLRAI